MVVGRRGPKSVVRGLSDMSELQCNTSRSVSCFERPELLRVRDSLLQLHSSASDCWTLRQNCIHHCTWQQRAAWLTPQPLHHMSAEHVCRRVGVLQHLPAATAADHPLKCPCNARRGRPCCHYSHVAGNPPSAARYAVGYVVACMTNTRQQPYLRPRGQRGWPRWRAPPRCCRRWH